MKKILALILVTVLALSTAACTNAASGSTTAAAGTTPAVTTAAAATTGGSETTTARKVLKVGVSQLVQHPALDAATEGFVKTLQAEFGDSVTIDVKNASGDTAVCATIVNQFVIDEVDLIMANATPALQAAAAGTNQIPILGTSITEYGVALEIENFSGTVGGNVSGTSDLAPLEEQANLFTELLPEAKNVGILFCVSEANSKYQVEVVKAALEAKGISVTEFPFTDSNDVGIFIQNAVNACDAIYIPTDNTAASCAETINNIAFPAGVPIITGEENICAGCGIATLSIDYYELGVTTARMAIEILKNGKDISTMPIEYFPNPVKKFSKERAEALGITIPAGFEEITVSNNE